MDPLYVLDEKFGHPKKADYSTCVFLLRICFRALHKAFSHLSPLLLHQCSLLFIMKSLLENFSRQFLFPIGSFCGYYGREFHAQGKKRPGVGQPGRVNLIFSTDGTDPEWNLNLCCSFIM